MFIIGYLDTFGNKQWGSYDDDCSAALKSWGGVLNRMGYAFIVVSTVCGAVLIMLKWREVSEGGRNAIFASHWAPPLTHTPPPSAKGRRAVSSSP